MNQCSVYHRGTVLTYISYLLCLLYMLIKSAGAASILFLKCAQNDGYLTSVFLLNKPFLLRIAVIVLF